MVVAVHTHPLEEFGKSLGFLATDIIPCVAVPFFFATSGYFYLSKLEQDTRLCAKYIKRLLFRYAVWSLPYIGIRMLQMIGHENIFGIIKICCFEFFVSGSFYHFWFFPALFISALLGTLMFRSKRAMFLISVCCYVIGVMGCAYKKIVEQIPILRFVYASKNFTIVRKIFLMGFPFFVLGYCVYIIREKKFVKEKNNILWIFHNNSKLLWILSFAIWLIEIGIVLSLGIADNIIITYGLYTFVASTLNLLISYPLKEYGVVASYCRILSNVCYYIHPLILFSLRTLLGIELPQTLMFILTVLISSFCGFCLQRINIRVVYELIR